MEIGEESTHSLAASEYPVEREVNGRFFLELDEHLISAPHPASGGN
jgi:hypothetical protein